jgi:hypothetical protein
MSISAEKGSNALISRMTKQQQQQQQQQTDNSTVISRNGNTLIVPNFSS